MTKPGLFKGLQAKLTYLEKSDLPEESSAIRASEKNSSEQTPSDGSQIKDFQIHSDENLSPKLQMIFDAFVLAEREHQGQTRKSGEPYITHPVAVACILADLKMDAETIAAALLHDVIEDTRITKKDLVNQFGGVVANLVDGVTKLSKIHLKSHAERQADYFRKMILAMSKDIRVIIVKLTDRLHNMRTINYLSREKQKRIAKETLEIFSPIANRLGMREISYELDELGFSILYPYRHTVLKKAMEQAKGRQEEIFKEIKSALKDAFFKEGLKPLAFSGREKQVYSIYQKMLRRGVLFQDVMDIHGFRIIVKTVDECYRMLGIVHRVYKPVSARFKDYIAGPKANGYQALHTTLFGPKGAPVEVQIRTSEMHKKAQSGIAAHWLYKTPGEDLKESHLRAQQWVKRLIEMQQQTGCSLEFIENFKIDLFPNEVYVFTPSGDILELPKNSTVIDFAYAVHTDLGNHCFSARINRRTVMLSGILKNGQTVQILTKENASPNPAWLDFVVTGKAKSGIRHFLKTREKEESILLGKHLLTQALDYFSLKLESVPKEVLDKVLAEVNLLKLEDLWVEMGLGYRSAVLEAYRIKAIFDHGSITDLEERMDLIQEVPLAISGTEGMVVQFATCCSPIPGDSIVGVLEKGQGITVHVESCKFANKHASSKNYLLLRWSEEVESVFSVTTEVDVLDEQGVLADMAVAISLANADIEDVKLNERSNSGQYKAIFRLKVKDRAHLAKVIRNLRKLKPVLHVGRQKIPA